MCSLNRRLQSCDVYIIIQALNFKTPSCDTEYVWGFFRNITAFSENGLRDLYSSCLGLIKALIILIDSIANHDFIGLICLSRDPTLLCDKRFYFSRQITVAS